MIFTLKWLSPYWRDHKYRMITIVVLGLVSASLNAINPLFIKNIINGLEKSLGVPYIKTNLETIFDGAINDKEHLLYFLRVFRVCCA